MTGGAEISFGGAWEVYLCEFERGTRNLFHCGSNEQGEDQKKRSSVQKFPQILVIVSKFLRFFTNSLVMTKKKRSSSQNFYEIRCESTKITKIRAVNTNFEVLGLDLHSTSPEPVNFFGAHYSLGGAKFSFRGGRAWTSLEFITMSGVQLIIKSCLLQWQRKRCLSKDMMSSSGIKPWTSNFFIPSPTLNHWAKKNRILKKSSFSCNAVLIFVLFAGVIRTLHSREQLQHVYCTETRPYNQGARLTAYEFVHDNIPATLVADSMVALLLKTKKISGR